MRESNYIKTACRGRVLWFCVDVRVCGVHAYLVVEQALELLDGEAHGEEFEEQAEGRGGQPRRARRPGLCMHGNGVLWVSGLD